VRAAQYKLEVMVCKDGRDYTVTCSCNGFSGQGKDMYIEEAFKESYEECMARLAEGTKP